MLQVWADGGALHPTLRAAIAPYEHARLDGSPAEGVHRDVKLGKTRASAAKVPYLAARLRFSENVSTYLSVKDDENSRSRFLAFFAEPERLLSKRWLPSPRLPPRPHLHRKELLARAYRTFPYNLTSWRILSEELQSGTVKQTHILTDVRAIMKDFFLSIFRPGLAFSFPETAALASAASDEPRVADLKFIEVVTMGVEKKKTIHEAVPASCALPVYVQHHKLHDDHGQGSPDELRSTPSGAPVLVDGLKLMEWTVATRHLRHWRRQAQTQNLAEVCWTEPVLAADLYHDHTDINISAWHLMKKLAAAGWMTQNVPEHRPDSSKHFLRDQVVKRKSYLRLLFELPTLWAGGVDRVATRQHELYYHCLRVLPNKTEVHPDQLVRDYVALLKRHGFEQPRSEIRVSNEIQDPVEEGRGEAEGASDSSHSDVDNVPAAEVRPQPPAEAEAAAAAEPEQDSLTLAALNLPQQVEGCRLHIDDNVAHGYRRLYVVCPCSGTTHRHQRPCRKYRGLGERQTQEHGYKEVAAFLAVWLRHSATCSSQPEHVRYMPRVQEVRDYISEKGWA